MRAPALRRLRRDDAILKALYGLVMAGIVLGAMGASGVGFLTYQELTVRKVGVDERADEWVLALQAKTSAAGALRELKTALAAEGTHFADIDVDRASLDLQRASTLASAHEASKRFDQAATRILTAAEQHENLAPKAYATRLDLDRSSADAKNAELRYLHALEGYNAVASSKVGALVGPHFGYDPILEP